MTNTFEEEFAAAAARQQRRREATRAMAADLGWLIGQQPGAYSWTATRTALAELVHEAWTTQTLLAPTGEPYTQERLARLAFQAVGQQPPRHINQALLKARMRLDARRAMNSRYQALAGNPRPITAFLAPNPTKD